MKGKHLIFNPPPGWPRPPKNWQPPAGWTPDPNWPDPPDGWQLWISGDSDGSVKYDDEIETSSVDTAVDKTASVQVDIRARLALLEAENAALRRHLKNSDDDVDELVVLDDERMLQSVGIYRYHHLKWYPKTGQVVKL